VRSLVFYIVVALLYYIVGTISRAVGDENLEIVYQQAVRDSPEKIRRLIELTIKLACFRDFPLGELQKLSNDLQSDSLGITALRLFVIERLDMRPPTDGRELQRICDAAGLKLIPRLLERSREGRGGV